MAVIIDEAKLYEQAGQTWRHFASWREKSLAGYLTVLAGLGVAFSYSNGVHMRVAVFAGAILVSAVFWILDIRSDQLLNACQIAAARLESGQGCYSQLNRIHAEDTRWLSYGVATSALAGGVASASVGALCIYLPECWGAELPIWVPFGAVVVSAATLVTLMLALWDKQRSGLKALSETVPSVQRLVDLREDRRLDLRSDYQENIGLA
jgi:hypothetical protein